MTLVITGDAKHTPIHKLEPFRAYLRQASPGRSGAVTGVAVRRLYPVRPLHCGLPDGCRLAELVQEARHGMFKTGLVPGRLALMERTPCCGTALPRRELVAGNLLE